MVRLLAIILTVILLVSVVSTESTAKTKKEFGPHPTQKGFVLKNPLKLNPIRPKPAEQPRIHVCPPENPRPYIPQKGRGHETSDSAHVTS